MDDSQLDAELAALTGTPAEESKASEAEAKAPKGHEAEADTETEVEPEAEGDEPEGDEETPEEDEEEEQPKKKAKLSGSERQKRRIAALEAELSTVRSRQPADGGVTADAIEQEIGKPPKEDDYKGDFLAFERAMTVYETQKAMVTRELKAAASKVQTAREAAMRDAAEAHQERVEEFAEKVPDFKAALKKASAEGLKASPTVEGLILDSDKSAHLLYHLAKNPDRLDRLNQMSERDAAREIGRIESRLSLPNPKQQTQAPKPVKAVKGGAAPSSPERDLNAWLSKKYGKH